MRNGKHTLTRIIVVALAGLAIGIPTAQASGQSPDSRPYYRGTDSALAPKSPSPDDRAFSRAIPVSSKTIIVSPDDRAFVRSTPVQPRTLQVSLLAPQLERGHGTWWRSLIDNIVEGSDLT